MSPEDKFIGNQDEADAILEAIEREEDDDSDAVEDDGAAE